jgi:hypothetical protein
MAKNGKNINVVLVLLIVFSLLIFAGSFVAGYFYKDKIFGLLGPRFSTDEGSLPEEKMNAATSLDSLPEGFPESFPIYQSAELQDSWEASGNTTRGISVVWTTDDSVNSVYGFYSTNLTNYSWEIVSEYKQQGSNTITFQKEEISGFVGITRGEEGKTLISVTMGIGE